MAKTPITVAAGDGIGPEIMEAVLQILEAAETELEIEEVDLGWKAIEEGYPCGITNKAWESIQRTHVLLKGPLATPHKKELRNPTGILREELDLFVKVEPCFSLAPFVASKFPNMHLTLIQENEEDLFVGLEYRQSREVARGTKYISRMECDRTIRFAFEWAQSFRRKKITTFTKSNLLPFTDGLFRERFHEIGEEYPEITKEHFSVNLGPSQLIAHPESFDILLLPNMYGDIIFSLLFELAGSRALGGAANFGEKFAMFDTVHGSAEMLAGTDMANPSGLLSAATLMLLHLHKEKSASLIHNAWLRTIEEGLHTQDLFQSNLSKRNVGCQEFTKAIISRLGLKPEKLKEVHFEQIKMEKKKVLHPAPTAPSQRELIGVDLFLYFPGSLDLLVPKLLDLLYIPSLTLHSIANRGVILWPQKNENYALSPEWHCRFMANGLVSHQMIASFLHRLADAHLEVIRTEDLYTLDGENGFSALGWEKKKFKETAAAS